jgi:hypothetical protein
MRTLCGLHAAAAAVGLSMLLFGGCARGEAIPDPEQAVDRYAAALEKGDAETIHALMSVESRQAVSLEQLRRILGEQREELGDHASAVRAPGREIKARAQVRYDDGEVATLDLVDGHFRVTAADALPAAARTPAQALGQLRRVLARRSYAGLLRVLSPRTRGAIEGDLRSLVEGLNSPDALPIEVVGDTATVVVPGGHRVELRREEGVWWIDDLD